MGVLNKKEPIILFLGDLLVFIISLWVMLLIRYFEIPDSELWQKHAIPFSILFVFWFLSFYIAGLYEKHTLILKKSLPKVLFNTLVINTILAVLFFYFIPYFSITPKTNLFVYLIILFILINLWRLFIFRFFSPNQKQGAILIGSGEEMKELKYEVNNNPRYEFEFVQSIDLDNYDIKNFKEDVVNRVYEDNISIIVADIKNPNIESFIPSLYNLIFARVQFLDKYKVYETLFDRIPLSLMSYNWFLENISSKNHVSYDILKRLMDIIISFVFSLFSLIFYPFVIAAILIEDGGNPFIVQERIGKGNKKIKLYKFRSMKVNDNGKWPTDSDERITKTGKFIRKTRIDELPQLWNVLKGDISMIGPRPDIIDLFEKLRDKVPYYSIRNIVKPGLSGWAQTHQEFPPHSIEETKIRLSYDLYYIKNRSFLLDLKITLQTLKTLISRTGK